MKVGIVAQKGNTRARRVGTELRDSLATADVTVVFDPETAAALDEAVTSEPLDAFAAFDLVVSVGGDGTFLFAARSAGATPILGVNLGEVGFLNAVCEAAAQETVSDEVAALRAGELTTRTLPRVAPRTDGWTGPPAANEVAVVGARRGHGGGIEVEIDIDGAHYSRGHADGVLVATPTGSTAYNLSEGGPLVHHGVSALVVAEMCARTGMPPLVVETDHTVGVTVTGGEEAAVVSDGTVTTRLEPPAEIRIETAEPPVHLAGPTADFFAGLDKLD